MIFYVHTDGTVDFRAPPPRAVVGPIFSKIGDRLILSAGMSDEEIQSYGEYGYQQKQIEYQEDAMSYAPPPNDFPWELVVIVVFLLIILA